LPNKILRGVKEGGMAKIDKFNFGLITIDGEKHRRDVLIFSDGTVKHRKGGFGVFGSHNIKREEVEELVRGEPEAIIVGTGMDGKAKLASGVEKWAKERNLSLIVQPSREALAKLNELTGQKKKIAALIHITC
jgi:hypothetical protein